jgi:hypothetical protein
MNGSPLLAGTSKYLRIPHRLVKIAKIAIAMFDPLHKKDNDEFPPRTKLPRTFTI